MHEIGNGNFLPFGVLSLPVHVSSCFSAAIKCLTCILFEQCGSGWGNASLHGYAVTVTMQILIRVPLYMAMDYCHIGERTGNRMVRSGLGNS